MNNSERFDNFMLAWLAREARFSTYVYFAPNTPIGYQVNRMVILIRRQHEPLFMEWMEKTHGITARKIQKIETIQKVIDILTPIRELVYDRENMESMQTILTSHPRRWKHDDVMRLIQDLDDD